MLCELSQWIADKAGAEAGLSPAFFYPLNISLPLTSRMSACHTLFWEQSKSPSGQEITKKQCYESWHLMNNYFKNLFLSVPSTPDRRVGSIKLFSQTMMRTSLKQGASCLYLFIFEIKFLRGKFTQSFYCESVQSKANNSGCKTSSPWTPWHLWKMRAPVFFLHHSLWVPHFCFPDGRW